MIFLDLDPALTPLPAADLLRRAAQATLDLHAAFDADLTLVLTGDEAIRDLNRRYRQIDAPTDVLAFPAGDADPETGRLYLGDVILSLARAADQAAAGDHPLEAELQLLVVHGVLHLLGHDHADSEDKDRMWAAQAEVLAHLGLPPTILHE
ncbi:MAG: rRNA maturation RNase YbeY [Anaerolineales bacterium]